MYGRHQTCLGTYLLKVRMLRKTVVGAHRLTVLGFERPHRMAPFGYRALVRAPPGLQLQCQEENGSSCRRDAPTVVRIPAKQSRRGQMQLVAGRPRRAEG